MTATTTQRGPLRACTANSARMLGKGWNVTTLPREEDLNTTSLLV
jgi:hypothetical protein